MKSKYIINLIIFLLVTSLHAQKLRLGGTAGVNITNLSGSELSTKEKFANLDSRTSFHLGVVSELYLKGKFYLGPEIFYSSQGAKQDDNELTLNYLQIPIMGRYYFTEGLNLEIGPQLGYLLSSSGDLTDQRISRDNFMKSDFSFAFGVGYKMSNGLFFRGRYFLGTNVAEARESMWTGDQVIDYEYFNRAAQFSLGYMF